MQPHFFQLVLLLQRAPAMLQCACAAVTVTVPGSVALLSVLVHQDESRGVCNCISRRGASVRARLLSVRVLVVCDINIMLFPVPFSFVDCATLFFKQVTNALLFTVNSGQLLHTSSRMHVLLCMRRLSACCLQQQNGAGRSARARCLQQQTGRRRVMLWSMCAALRKQLLPD